MTNDNLIIDIIFEFPKFCALRFWVMILYGFVGYYIRFGELCSFRISNWRQYVNSETLVNTHENILCHYPEYFILNGYL
jgi:hypothetical protein